MSQLADTKPDARALSGAGLSALLERAESEEVRVSERRSLLHDRIDHMLRRGNESPEDQVDLRAALHLERELSDRRFELHCLIAELQSEKSRRLAARLGR